MVLVDLMYFLMDLMDFLINWICMFFKGILETDDPPEPLCLVEGIRSYPWHIKTKYYEADVHVCAMDLKTIGNQAFADSVNAVILCFDSASVRIIYAFSCNEITLHMLHRQFEQKF